MSVVNKTICFVFKLDAKTFTVFYMWHNYMCNTKYVLNIM